ncbi:hypothetical protein MHYP_G00265960 [Metynnis hypsauchen]
MESLEGKKKVASLVCKAVTHGKNHLKYEEVPGSVIKIKDEEVKATWSTATDYRRSSAPVVGCWLVPYESVLQGELSDFIACRRFKH